MGEALDFVGRWLEGGLCVWVGGGVQLVSDGGGVYEGKRENCGPPSGVCGRNFLDNKLYGSIPVELGLLTALTNLYVPPPLTRNLYVEIAIRKCYFEGILAWE